MGNNLGPIYSNTLTHTHIHHYNNNAMEANVWKHSTRETKENTSDCSSRILTENIQALTGEYFAVDVHVCVTEPTSDVSDEI